MCVNVTKVGQCHPKLLLVQSLHWTYKAVKYEVYIYRADAYRAGSQNVAKFCDVPEIRGGFAGSMRKSF